MTTIDWPPPRRRRPVRLIALAVLAAVFLGGGTALSFYVQSLWFGSLGFSDVFLTILRTQGVVFTAFFALTALALYGSFLLLKPARLGELAGGTILINGQPVRLPVEPVIRTAAAVLTLLVATVSGLGMAAEWQRFALYWNSAPEALGAAAQSAAATDPIFGRPLSFYFFTLPVWRLVAGWFTTIAVLVTAAAAFFSFLSGGARLLEGRRGPRDAELLRPIAAALAVLLLALAVRVYLGRFDRLFVDHTIFSGVTYTDANVSITGLTIVSAALILGALGAAVAAAAAPSVRWLAFAIAPAAAAYVIVGLVGWYVNSFIVRPNQLARETPYIAHNIEMTRRAYGLDTIEEIEFPAETGVDAVGADANRDTLENIRLWDWRALQDTLRQIQEIRTYYDFPDIDIDRYELGGRIRQMMLAVRELNIERLPESSRNWINEKLVYTHGYGITMNTANEFSPEGLPNLLLQNMPVESATSEFKVTRPEIYFGEVTNNDVYVKTRQQEFNYPEGDANTVTSYDGTGGIVLGGLLKRTLIALDRGDITRLPFNDDVTPESRLLMRRNIRERVLTLAPFLVLDSDPYIVLDDEGRLFWMLDGFTTSDAYPYARHFRLDRTRLNYMRNSVKAVVDAYNGQVSFYVFDPADPVIAAYRGVFPSLFQDAGAMPPALRRHVRYPELNLEVQAAVYGLYHMTDPTVFYNREDLWTVASQVTANASREQAAEPMEANYVLMKLPGASALEFVEILPFTPANRNNLIGWIAGRSDEPHYGKAVVYKFPENRIVDGPLQIEARIDQNAQLSAQLSLWNQQGSSVRRGNLIVIPVGKALLYAQPIFLQAQRSPMPELRIVVLALQDRLVYGPTFDAAMASLFRGVPSSLDLPSIVPGATPRATPAAPLERERPAPAEATDLNTLISEAARDLEEYQRLTAEGRLGEAGQRLEALKRKLDELNRRRQ
jgi:uncharacterized membrane protein (UPF0182 family)